MEQEVSTPRRIDSYSFALEDVFALYINRFLPGFFVDIGCGHPQLGSNSKLLESCGWTGICIDISKHPEWDSDRSTRCYSVDANSINYSELFRQEDAPRLIDFLSIDVDDSCLDVLTHIPLDDYQYRAIAIEHDFYRTSHLRDVERSHLKHHGYDLVCADVVHEPGKPFEDWWVKAEHVEQLLTDRIRSHGALDIEIIRKFGYKNTITRAFGFHGTYPQLEIA